MAKICGSGAACELLCPVIRPGLECLSLFEFASTYALEGVGIEGREVGYANVGQHVDDPVE